MGVLERDVARPICLVLFAISNKRHAFCNETNDGRLYFDRLGVSKGQYKHV